MKQINDKHTEGLLRNNPAAEGILLSHMVEKGSRWLKSWVLWSVLLILIPGGIGLLAMAILFKLPAAPDCPKIFTFRPCFSAITLRFPSRF